MTSFRPLRLVWFATEVGFFIALSLAMNLRLDWGLNLEELGILLVIAGVSLAIPAGWDRAKNFPGGISFALAWAILATGLWAVSRWMSHPLSPAAALYLGTATIGLGLVFRLFHRSLSANTDDWQEYLRLGSLVLFAGGMFSPFFTSQLIGGLDARWYGYVMADALEQARAGVFPVLVGQGEYMYNGAVHPYRTAPYYHNLGIGIDLLTGRVLSALAVQHLVVIVTAILAAVVSYICVALLIPGRRWIAWMLALLYVSGPVTALYIYASEMYMTFTALAWLPLVLFGNVRLIRHNDRAGWLGVAVGLGLVCLCHAPVGIWAGLFTAGVQGLRLLTRDFELASWRRAAGGAVLFAGLLAGYFFSISELSLGAKAGLKNFPIYALGLAVGLASIVRLMASGNAWWLAPGAAALVALWWTLPPHAVWLALALVAGAGLAWSGRWVSAVRWRAWLPESLAVVLLASGLLSMRLMPDPSSTRGAMHAHAVKFATDQFPQRFRPISPDAVLLGDLQPGYAALALLVAAVFVARFKRGWELRILVLTGVPLVCMLAPVPGVNAFLYSILPDPVYAFCSVGLWLRFLPLLAVVAIFAGAVALGALTEGRHSRWRRTGVLAGLSVALIWNNTEMRKPIERGYRAINPTADTTAFYRTETAALYYGYDRLPQPRYVTNGIVDYHLESRLLRVADHALIPEPLLGAPGEKSATFTTRPNPFNPNLLHLEPKFAVPPGERLLLRFDFFDRSYEGYLTIGGPEFERTYYLPEAGNHAKSFGVAAARPKVISVWNTRPQPQELELQFMAAVAPEAGKPFGDFARIHFQPFKPDDLQIKTRSLIPYRAEVALETSSYLETPRVFLPGYRATVNGRPVPVEKSPDHLVMIRLEPGPNLVEVAYRGTWAARVFFGFSALVWLAVLGYAAWRLRSGLLARRVVASGAGA